jgi:hypothetical protein
MPKSLQVLSYPNLVDLKEVCDRPQHLDCALQSAGHRFVRERDAGPQTLSTFLDVEHSLKEFPPLAQPDQLFDHLGRS